MAVVEAIYEAAAAVFSSIPLRIQDAVFRTETRGGLDHEELRRTQTCYLNPPQMGHTLSHHDTEFDGRPFQARQARQSLSSKRDTTPWPHEVRRAVVVESPRSMVCPHGRGSAARMCAGKNAQPPCRIATNILQHRGTDLSRRTGHRLVSLFGRPGRPGFHGAVLRR